MDALDLKAKISMDSSDYDKGLDSAKSKLSAFGGALKTGIATATKVTAAGVAAGAAAVAGLTKAAVASYAEYEQLVGGVETLFGSSYKTVEEYAEGVGISMDHAAQSFEDYQNRADTVMANAAQAYKTAGMSTNDYMETVTGFAASLNASLGEFAWQSANYADMAVGDMADNANKMGTSMESIKNAYAGFSKQNFTMLDNLKLGYGGTKTEMERLLHDAEEIAGYEFGSLDTSSFADVVEAIHIVQEELGIYGTTAKEATETITGSLNMTKAAWDNLVTGLADKDADMETLMGNLVNSIAGYTDEAGNHVKGVIDNLLPAIETALTSIGDLLQRVVPVIVEKLPGLVQQILPPLLSAAASLVSGVAQAIPSLVSTIASQIPMVISQLVSALATAVPQLLTAVNDLLGQVLNMITNFDFASAATTIAEKITSLFDSNGALSGILDKAFHIVEALAKGIGQAAPTLLPAAMELITDLANFLTQQVPDLIQAALDLVMGLVDGLTNPNALAGMLEAALNLILTLDQGLIDAIPKLIEAVPSLIQSLVEAIGRFAPQLIVAAISIMIQLKLALIQNIPTLIAAIPDIIKALVEGFKESWPTVKKMGIDLIKTIKEGIMSMSPVQWGKDLIDSFVQGIKSGIGKVRDAVSNIAQTVKSYIGFSEPELGPLSNFHTYAPDMMKLFAEGIADNENIIANQMQKSLSLPDIQANASGKSAGNVTINVYGAEGQSEERLVEIIQNRMLHELNMQRAVSYA